jgi:hypothetical protein
MCWRRHMMQLFMGRRGIDTRTSLRVDVLHKIRSFCVYTAMVDANTRK